MIYLWICLRSQGNTNIMTPLPEMDLKSLYSDIYVYMVEWEETASYTHMVLSSNPSFSRAGRAATKTVWEPYRSCTGTLPLDYDRCVKEKNRKKNWTE